MSYRTALPGGFLTALGEAQASAKSENRATLIRFNGFELFIEPSGGQGGYAFRAHTGPFGLIWKFREATTKSPWSVHVKFRAHGLAIKGPLKMKEEADGFLLTIGCKFESIDVRVSRADYAVDMLLGDFHLNTGNFVFHSRSKVSEYIERIRIGDEYTYARIGRLPGKQLCVYDKSGAVSEKNDSLWKQFYFDFARQRLGLVVNEFSELKIWRFELRAGKQFLDKQIKPRTWDSFAKEVSPIYQRLAQSFKLKLPQRDDNRTRWPLDPIWIEVVSEVSKLTFNQKTTGVSDALLRKLRQEYSDGLDKQLVGLLLSSAACEGIDSQDFSRFARDRISLLTEDYSKSAAFRERYVKRRAEFAAQYKI
ncbi:hypothetical protein [Hyphococcus sp.]|uniref:hypothetical protein n=1 Tax=Hyphococcus sp. TaxID=2038636 RepID=UPI003CCC1B36